MTRSRHGMMAGFLCMRLDSAAQAAEPEKLFALASPEIEDNAMLPLKYAGSDSCGAGSRARTSRRRLPGPIRRRPQKASRSS